MIRESVLGAIIAENFRSFRDLPVAKYRKVTVSLSCADIESLISVSDRSMKGVTSVSRWIYACSSILR